VVEKKIWRAVAEIGFIIFLFYSNLLMGEFTHSAIARGMNFVRAVNDVFTGANFSIALVAAVIGHAVVEFVRKRL
jgi:hypothetical protein